MSNSVSQEQKNIFAKNLNRLLKENHKVQADLVTHFGLTASTVSDWCNAKKYPRVDKVQMLADYFGVRKSDLTENASKPIPIYFNNKPDKLPKQMTSEEIAESIKQLSVTFKKFENEIIQFFKIEQIDKYIEDTFKNIQDNKIDVYANNTDIFIYYLDKLNNNGRKEILKRIVELSQIEKYTKQNSKTQLALKLARNIDGKSELQTIEENESDYINAPKNDIDM